MEESTAGYTTREEDELQRSSADDGSVDVYVAPPAPASTSPKWGPTTKLVVGLTIVAIIAALVIQFRGIIGPMILAFILAIQLHPVAEALSKRAKISFRMAVNLIYILVILLLRGLFTATGFAIVQQLQSLIDLFSRFLNDLPEIVEFVTSQVFVIGPFELDLTQFELGSLTDQLLNTIQPIIRDLGGLVGSLAGSAVSTLGWPLFIILVSYFLVADANRVQGEVVHIEIPGYNEDFRRLGHELRSIWNSFLRGQFIIIILVIIADTLLMTVLGMRYAVGIAILAGLARFVPYVGPAVVLIVAGLVAFFSPSNYFGLQPVHYTILVLVSIFVLDQVFDNLVSPRFMGKALGVHPAAVLIAAIIAANLIGIIGLLLAAPVLATLQVLSRYVIRKMFDLDPWPEVPEKPEPSGVPLRVHVDRLRGWVRTLVEKRHPPVG